MGVPPVDPTSAQRWTEFQEANASGRRSEAARAMASFVASLSDADRPSFTYWFCRHQYGRRRDKRMRSHLMPLARGVVLPVLLEGARRGEPTALRWLVHATLDGGMPTHLIAPELHERSATAGLLAAALAKNPDAGDLWQIAFHFELAEAEWGVHHLAEGVLSLPEPDCLRSVQRARHIADAAPAGALSPSDLRDLETVCGLLSDFRVWKESGAAGSFPDWCRACGRDYRLPVPVYYES